MTESETAGLFVQWFLAAPVARVLAAIDMTVLSTNPAADNLLRDGDVVVIRNGMLGAADRDFQATLSLLFETSAPERPLLLPSTDGRAPLVAQAFGLNDGLVCLELRRAGPVDTAVALPDLSAIFNLTRGEKALIGPLIEGMGNDEIAQRLGVSIETVRTHLKNACAKLGVSGRAQFVARIMHFLPY